MDATLWTSSEIKQDAWEYHCCWRGDWYIFYWNTFVFQTFNVEGASMETTMYTGETV